MLRLFPVSRAEHALLAVFLLSTPIAAAAHYGFQTDRDIMALANCYAFSSAYCLLYLWPLLFGRGSFAERLDAAQANWVVWVSCLTQIVFQIPHNAFTQLLLERRGSLIEWPFFAYGLADVRWATYTDPFWQARNGDSAGWFTTVTDSAGLAPEVWLINLNDGLLGLLVFLAFLAARRWPRFHSGFVLLTLFRDGTLFRENCEYMFMHHYARYPFTTAVPRYRPHAIACLWLVNGLWFVAPVLSFVWAWHWQRGAERRASTFGVRAKSVIKRD